MIRFNNDYNRNAHRDIMAAIIESSENSYTGYGKDEVCVRAENEIKKYITNDKVDIHFLVGGTQTNFTVISSILRPYQSVISADIGHINVHETGAVERMGHKIEAVNSKDGKLIIEDVRGVLEAYKNSEIKEHITEPKILYISFPTELGTLYTKEELSELSKLCKEYSLYLYIDGARLSYGLGSAENDVSLSDLVELSDVLYCGGTKCGTLFGEAVIISNDDLKRNFRSCMKQNGALLAKGWLLGLQFEALFKKGLYFEIGKEAVRYAKEIREAFRKAGRRPYIESPTNQQFILLSEKDIERLNKKFDFEYYETLNDGNRIVRFCTSWSTTIEEVNELLEEIRKLDK